MTWQTKKLGEICNIDYGTRVVKSRIIPGDFDVYGGGGKTFLLNEYNREDCTIVSRFAMSKNCVRKVTGKFFLNDSGLSVSTKDKDLLTQEFLDKFLFASEDLIYSLGRGQAQRNLHIDAFREIEIPLPPLAIQHKIVAILDEKFAKLRAAKRLRQEAIVDTEKIFGATLREIFEEGKEKGWEEIKLGDVVNRFQYGSSKKSLNTGEIPCLRMGNLQKGEIDWNNLKYAPKDEEIEKFLLKEGDVLFNRTNSPDLVGKTSVYRGEQPAVFAGYLIRIDYMKDKVSGYYLNYCLNSDFAKKFCWNIKTDGVSQSNINAQKLATFIFPLPPLGEQQKIVTRLNALSTKLRTLRDLQQSQLEDMKKLEKAYLREAFRDK